MAPNLCSDGVPHELVHLTQDGPSESMCTRELT